MPDGSFNPYAAAGMTATANGSYAWMPVIDIGHNLNPNAPPGEPGSGLARTAVSPAGEGAGPSPVVAPGGGAGATVTPSVDAAIASLRGGGQPSNASIPASAPAPFDPYAAAGMVKGDDGTYGFPGVAPAPTVPPVASKPPVQELRNQPWYQGIKDTIEGAHGSLVHGATLGLDEILAPLIPAITKSLTQGVPFSQAYDQSVAEQRTPRTEFEAQHPVAGAALETIGSLPTAEIASPFFASSPAGATLARRALTAAQNTAVGAGIGGATGATMTDGDINARLAGARQGAEFGGALSLAAPAIASGATQIARAITPNANVSRIAGQVLRDRAGLGPNDTVPLPETAPIPDAAGTGTMPIGSGAAFNSPGLASQERTINQSEPIGAVEMRTDQNQAIRNAATTAQPGGVQLASATTAPDASIAAVHGIQGAYDVLREEGRRLWTQPELAANKPDVELIKKWVQRAIGRLPGRFQKAIERSPDLQAALADLYDLKPGASLVDVNEVRSDILAASRGLPFSERFAKKAADDVASAVLSAIESNPSLRMNIKAMAQYAEARDFTNRMWSALEKPQFQMMLQASEDNRKGIDAATVASKMFNFTRGSERTPEGVAKILDMLDETHRMWNGLGTASRASAALHGILTGEEPAMVAGAGLDPSVAAAARDQLAQGTRDFIVHSMLDAAEGTVRDANDSREFLMNRLSAWIDKNRDWIGRSRLFNADQIDLLDRIKKSAILAKRAENYRGGPGSQTFEHLAGDRYVDAFMGPLLGRTTGMIAGAAAGAVIERLFPATGIGALIGAEIAGAAAGPSILRRLYAAPRKAVMDKIIEAIRDPVIATDLMRKAGAKVSPRTTAWARSIIALEPSAQMARVASEPEQPTGAQP